MYIGFSLANHKYAFSFQLQEVNVLIRRECKHKAEDGMFGNWGKNFGGINETLLR